MNFATQGEDTIIVTMSSNEAIAAFTNGKTKTLLHNTVDIALEELVLSIREKEMWVEQGHPKEQKIIDEFKIVETIAFIDYFRKDGDTMVMTKSGYEGLREWEIHNSKYHRLLTLLRLSAHFSDGTEGL